MELEHDGSYGLKTRHGGEAPVRGAQQAGHVAKSWHTNGTKEMSVEHARVLLVGKADPTLRSLAT
jgi:hypothetical protein